MANTRAIIRIRRGAMNRDTRTDRTNTTHTDDHCGDTGMGYKDHLTIDQSYD
jgi:hypothetical protein